MLAIDPVPACHGHTLVLGSFECRLWLTVCQWVEGQEGSHATAICFMMA